MQNNNKSKELTLGSLFDGSGGFPLAGMIAGIKPVWASEIEPFPVRVTTKNIPFMKHYWNIQKINGGEIEPVDIITFGSPCQDMSMAGCRNGLNGSRSSLFYEAIRVIKEMRKKTNGEYPKYIVWENVRGAFSSNKGEDFRCVLEEVCKIVDERISIPRPEKWEKAGCIVGDNFSVGWRLLNAEYWGVPQRRERIFLIGCLGGGGSSEILFESEGLSGYSKQNFKTWQRVANSSSGSIRGKTEELNQDCEWYVFENHSEDSRYTELKNTMQTITQYWRTGGNNVPIVVSKERLTDRQTDNYCFDCTTESKNFECGSTIKNKSHTIKTDSCYTLKIRSGCEGGQRSINTNK